jgi:hypothetical protein
LQDNRDKNGLNSTKIDDKIQRRGGVHPFIFIILTYQSISHVGIRNVQSYSFQLIPKIHESIIKVSLERQL